jgi:hypothetical protein
MAVEIWLERLTIISMDKDSTPANDCYGKLYPFA